MGKRTTIARIVEQEQREARFKAALRRGTMQAQSANQVYFDPLTVVNRYRTHFIADPHQAKHSKSSDPYRQLIPFVRKAFAKYPVGGPLLYSWSNLIPKSAREVDEARGAVDAPRQLQLHRANIFEGQSPIDLRLWYITAASGGSLYKEHAKNKLTKAEVHYLITCRHELHAAQAMTYAIARGFGADDGRAFILATSRLPYQLSVGEKLRNLIRFFVREMPRAAELDQLFDYLRQAQWNVLGTTLNQVRKRSEEWHRAMAKLQSIGGGSWPGHAVADYTVARTELHQGKEEEVEWKLIQVRTGNALYDEGQAMRHCVAGYKQRCISGECSIWSLRRNSERKLTIELHNNGTIVQARGYANRNAKADELAIMKAWAHENDLKVGYI